jgi:Protein of unknown function (DUF1552)
MSSLHRLQRRTFLAALGLGIAAPLALRMSRLAVAQSGARLKRLFIIFVPHGFPVEHFDPVTDNGDFNLKAKGIGGLGPLEPFKQHVTMVRGIGMANMASNHVAIRAALTGFLEGGTVDSIDYVIAQGLKVTPHALGAIPYKKTEGFSVDSHLMKHGGAWVRALESPLDAKAELFQGLGGGGSPMAVDEGAFQAEAVALTAKQVDRMKRELAGLTTEETKLGIHLEALQGLKAGGDASPTSCTAVPSLPAVDATASIDPLDETQFAKILDAQLELAANAMVCGTGRVITLQCLWVNSNILMNFPGGPGIPTEHHIGLSHAGLPREPYAKAQQWFFQRFADKLLTVLNQPDPADPTHTVLDNSLVYITTEVSDGGNHNSDAGETWVFGQPMYTYLPQILIGGAGGYLKPGGRIVKVEDKRPHTDVLATIADAMGVPLTNIGGQPVNLIQELKA